MKVFSSTPFVSVELLTYMEEQFPDKLPKGFPDTYRCLAYSTRATNGYRKT